MTDATDEAPPAAAGLETPPADMAERLAGLARRLFDATAGVLPAEVTMRVHVLPGGLTRVEYWAAVGEVLGKGVAERRTEFGASPEAAAARLYEQVVDIDIARTIRTAKLREMAKELGFQVRPAAK